MKWIKYDKEEGLAESYIVWVCNTDQGYIPILAQYQKKKNIFFPFHGGCNSPLAVTHWLRLPDYPVD